MTLFPEWTCYDCGGPLHGRAQIAPACHPDAGLFLHDAPGLLLLTCAECGHDGQAIPMSDSSCRDRRLPDEGIPIIYCCQGAPFLLTYDGVISLELTCSGCGEVFTEFEVLGEGEGVDA